MNQKEKALQDKGKFESENLFNLTRNKLRKVNLYIDSLREPELRTVEAREYWDNTFKRIKNAKDTDEKLELVGYHPKYKYPYIYHKIEELNK